MKKIKSNAEASFEDYVIRIAEEGSVTVLKGGDRLENTKQALRDISEIIGFKYDEKWNTRQFGSKLLAKLNGGQSKKKVFVFVYFDMARVGVFSDEDVNSCLSEYGYDSLSELFSSEGPYVLNGYSESDNTDWFDNVNGVKVIEGELDDDRPYDLIEDIFDQVDDIKDFVEIDSNPCPIPAKGVAFKQLSTYIGQCAEMIVDDDFVFDPAKLVVKIYSIEYDGVEYRYQYWMGEDEGDPVFYCDGVQVDY